MVPEVTEAIRDVSLDEAAPSPAEVPTFHPSRDGHGDAAALGNGNNRQFVGGHVPQARVRCGGSPNTACASHTDPDHRGPLVSSCSAS